MLRKNPSWLIWVALAGGLIAASAAPAADDDAIGFELTPPRLSFLDGDVSFFRPGSPDWVPAAINTPLAAGDELYASKDANLEIQIGASSFVRAGDDAELALTSLEPDFLQLRVTEGTVSLDLRSLKPSQSFEVDTPNGAFTIDRSGYYRVDVYEDTTTFIARRGGSASVTLVQGTQMTLMGSEQVVITGADSPKIETYAAPELDAWDRWNYARTDQLLDAVSTRYVPEGVYGAYDLDEYGTWRVVPTYGAVWLPSRVAVGWAPYTTGRWLYDPFYGWSWVDVAPWGWAPYHYGRWVYVSGLWGWAPGPIVTRPYYAPALVAFYGGNVSVGISIGGPIGWVALGWGEPLSPWWGPARFRSHVHWAGWGGPHVVNRVVVKHNKVFGVHDIHSYENSGVKHAFVAMGRDQFGRRSVKKGRIESARIANFKPLAGDLELRPASESLAPSTGEGRRPPRERRDRTVVATRAPRVAPIPELQAPSKAEESANRARPQSEKRAERSSAAVEPNVAERNVRVIRPAKRQAPSQTLERPPFGEHADHERAAAPPAPRYTRQGATGAAEKRATREPVQSAPSRAESPPSSETRTSRKARSENAATNAAPPSGASERQRPAPAAERELPGVPANRVYRGREKRARPEQTQQGGSPGSQGNPHSNSRGNGNGNSRGNQHERGPSR